MNSDHLVMVLTAGLFATACAILGSFLLLRRQALMCDAVSHAVLPGIVLVFVLLGHRNSLLTVIGAIAFGVLCVLGIEGLRGTKLVGSDAAIALVFPALFSLGVIGITSFASGAHLDLDATIYGELTFAPLRTTELAGFEVPTSVLLAAGAAILVVGLVIVLWRPLQSWSFDTEFAELAGVRGSLISRVLLSATATVAVTAFESVGAVLIVALFVVPAATAQLLARRLEQSLVLAVGIGWLSAIGGQWTATRYDTSIPGTMGLVAGICFVAALLLAPRRGVVARLRQGGARRVPTTG
ncbi:MAG: metal ABC transporter permease [Pseudonocardiaceae bacterium]